MENNNLHLELTKTALIDIQEELIILWNNASAYEKYSGSYIDNLSDYAVEEFFCIYKRLSGDWSKLSLANEIIRMNFNNIIKSLN